MSEEEGLLPPRTDDQKAASGWRTIDSAPRDGTVILGFWLGYDTFPEVICWDKPSPEYDDGSHPGFDSWGAPVEDNHEGLRWVYADWALHDACGPVEHCVTHWMPLPLPPSIQTEAEGEGSRAEHEVFYKPGIDGRV